MSLTSKNSSRRKNPGRSIGRRRPQESGAVWKVAAIVALPTAALVGGGIGLSAYVGVEQADKNYCYSRADQHEVALFLDNSLTQALSPAQLRDYRTTFERAYEAAPANARLMAFTTAKGASGSLAEPEFVICKPARTPGEQEALGAPSKPAPNLHRTAEEAEAKYFAEVERILSEAQNPALAAADSPILEQLQAISRHPDFQGRRRSLSVITDGIQNSEIARFCSVKGDMPPFASFAERLQYRHVEPRPFTGTDVSFLLVEFGQFPNDWGPYCSNDEIRAWWPEYFTSNGARDVELTRLRFWSDS